MENTVVKHSVKDAKTHFASVIAGLGSAQVEIVDGEKVVARIIPAAGPGHPTPRASDPHFPSEVEEGVYKTWGETLSALR